MPFCRPTKECPRWSARGGAALSVALLASLAVAGSATAQQVELRWKFQPGETYFYEQVQTTETGTPMGEMVQTQTVKLRQEVLGLSDDGSADVRVTHDSVSVVIDGPMGRQEWDSGSGEPPQDPALQAMAQLVGASFEMNVAENGVVNEISGMEALLERMSGAIPGGDPAARAAATAMLEEMFGEEGMRALMQQGMQAFPEEAVSPGAEWQREMRLPLPFGEMRFEYLYTLREVVSDGGSQIAMIDVGGSIGELEAESGHPMASMMSFSDGELNGDLEFDIDRGLIVRASLTSTVDVSFADQATTMRSLHEMRLVGGGDR